MSNQTIVQILRDKAAADPVVSSVLHMWALRERARHEVTIAGLAARMKKEGFLHDKKQYEPLLRLMAQLGLGRLQTDSKGRVVALKQVETKLQSLGRAVCDPTGTGPLVPLKKKNRFRPLVLHYDPKATPQTAREASVTIEDETKRVTFKVPKGANDDQVTEMVRKILKFSVSA